MDDVLNMLQALFDLQLGSIKHYNIGTFSPDVKVHHIVHRYAQLTASLLCLNADYQVSLISCSNLVVLFCFCASYCGGTSILPLLRQRRALFPTFPLFFLMQRPVRPGLDVPALTVISQFLGMSMHDAVVGLCSTSARRSTQFCLPFNVPAASTLKLYLSILCQCMSCVTLCRMGS